MNKELKPCPFCGAEVELETMPLWHGGHGYQGCYEFIIKCKNCGAQPNYPQNDTVYRSENEAIKNVIKAWNRRVSQEKKNDDKNSGIYDDCWNNAFD